MDTDAKRRSGRDSEDPRKSAPPVGVWARWKVPLTLGGLVLLLAAAPSIVASTPLLGWGVRQATSGMEIKVAVGSASLGWFSPVGLNDVRVTDPEGEQIAHIPRLQISKSLLGLAQDWHDLGIVRLHDPELVVVVHDRTTNWEQILFPPDEEEEHDGEEGPPVRFQLAVRGGLIRVEDGQSERGWTLEDVSVDYDATQFTAPQPLTFSGGVRRGTKLGQIQGKGHLPGGLEDSQFSLALKQVPLEIADQLGRWFGYDVMAEGTLDGQLEIATQNQIPQARLNLTAANVDLTLPGSDGTDHWTDGTFQCQGGLMLVDNHLQAEQFTLATDWATIFADGDLPLPADTTNAWETLQATTFGPQPWQLRLEGDLAKLAAAFPALLNIKQGVTIEQGKFSLALNNTPKPTGSEVTGAAQLTRIVARTGGQETRWDTPLDLQVRLSQREGMLLVEDVACQSSFLTAGGSGTVQKAQLEFQLDWNQLALDLARIVELDGFQFSGTSQGRIELDNLGGGRLAAGAKIDSRDLKLGSTDALWLAETRLDAQTQATLVVAGGELVEIETGLASLKTQASTIGLQLTEPMILAQTKPRGLKLQVQGPLAEMWPKVAPLMGMESYQLGGTCHLLTKVVVDTNRWTIEAVNLDVTDLVVASESLNLREPKMQLSGGAILDWETGQLTSQQFTLVGTSVSARGSDIIVPLTDASSQYAGGVAYRVDLARGLTWIVSPETLGPTEVSGEMSGKLVVDLTAETIKLANTGQIKNWQVKMPASSQPSGGAIPVSTRGSSQSNSQGNPVTWNEPNIAFLQEATLNRAQDQLQVTTIQVQSSAVQLAASGVIDAFSTTADTNIQGQSTYDWNRLAPLVASYLGSETTIRGQRTSPFQFRGPLWGDDSTSGLVVSPRWEAATNLGWQQAMAYGVPIGDTTAGINLRRGTLLGNLAANEVSGGKITVNPRLTLNTTPMKWEVDAGRVIENVAITPQICRGWLMYVAPVVADATRVEGRFTLDTDGGVFPLADPMQGQTNGILHIQGAEVRSGPLAQNYVMLAKQIEGVIQGKPLQAMSPSESTLMRIPAQQVRYRMVGGRMYHENLTMMIGDVRIISSGWVAADQSMQLTTQIPIQDAWVQKAPWLAAMRGTGITVPITGTATSPKVDGRVLENMAAQTLDNAARGLLQEGVNRGLQELFRPR
ncbi:MAG: hypothetical protein WD045_03025 [Pirellulaceae bacterium]